MSGAPIDSFLETLIYLLQCDGVGGALYSLERTSDGAIALKVFPEEGPRVSLGAKIDTYITAHESFGVSREDVTQAFLNSETYDDFSGKLCSRGMSESQARWIWFWIKS